MIRYTRHANPDGIQQPRRRWPWTVAAVAIATALAAAKLRAKRRASTDNGEDAPAVDIDATPPTARQKAATAANQAAISALTAARHTPQAIGEVVTQLRSRAADRRRTRRSDAGDSTSQTQPSSSADAPRGHDENA